MRRAAIIAITSLTLAGIALSQVPATPPTPPLPAVPAVPAVPAHPEEGSGRKAYLGIDPREVTSDRLATLKLKEERGVEVAMLDQDGPAGKAGIHEHDVILSFNGAAVQGVDELKRMIRETPAGRTVALGISRDGQPMSMKVKLGSRNDMATMHMPTIHVAPMAPMAPMGPIEIPEIHVFNYPRRYGLMVEGITPQMGAWLGATEGHGVLIRSVEKGSEADQAGFRAGDVIVRIGNEQVEDVSDWSRLLRQQKGRVNVTVIRDRRTQNLGWTIPERRRSDASNVHVEIPDMSELEVQMAQLRPQIEEQMRRAQEEVRREMARHQDEWNHMGEKMQREMEKQKLQFEKMQKDLEDLQFDFQFDDDSN